MARGEMRKNIKSFAPSRKSTAQHGRQEDFSMFAIIIFLITHRVVYYSFTKRDFFFVSCVGRLMARTSEPSVEHDKLEERFSQLFARSYHFSLVIKDCS